MASDRGVGLVAGRFQIDLGGDPKFLSTPADVSKRPPVELASPAEANQLLTAGRKLYDPDRTGSDR